jgi:hypothetical protein
MTVLYPVADTAEAALHAPRGYAARERDAAALGGTVCFVTEMTGPAFASREAALDAYAGRVEDNRPGAPPIAPEQRWRTLAPVASPDGRPLRRPPSRPSFADGHRWPAPADAPPLLWRLVVSYWRVETDAPKMAEAARKLRRSEAGRELDGAALSALAHQPLQAFRPQRPLDIGLFEAIRPEAPDLTIPDE